MSNIRKNGEWNNGGYIQCRIWENGIKRIILKHRYIMERAIGRRLKKHEDVHHIDGDKSNNAIENLELLTHGKHSSITGATRHIHKTKTASSKYYGVAKLKTGYWSARIKRNKKLLWASMFNSELKAAKAYDLKARKLKVLPLNFSEGK